MSEEILQPPPVAVLNNEPDLESQLTQTNKILSALVEAHNSFNLTSSDADRHT